MQIFNKELTYNNKETIKPAFPIPRIEIRKPLKSDDEKAFQIFDNKLKKIAAEEKNNHSYSYNDGEKIYTEKEMILRSKLYKIDTVISGYFKHSSHENNTTS